ncbi:MAG: bis(5'-nucleosyl)-tetraphosphatase (symmetrical) YqeK [Anaerococcus sp.]|nr:bis(5'-nucleosyl)-tetraphosphatase (symmetrical) YqeK [Anaerococcus sp.]
MFDIDSYKDRLLEDIGKKRYKHSLRVVDAALKLSEDLDIDVDKVKIAAFLHDCAKYNEERYIRELDLKIDEKIHPTSPVIHAFVGAEVAKKVYNIKDNDILDAIRYHTTGRANMSLYEKIVFLADAIEEKRDYPGVEDIREKAFEDIDEGLLECLDHNIKFLIDKKSYIESLTFEARNYLIKEKNGKS